MTGSTLLALDLVAALVTAGAWVAAAVLARGAVLNRRRGAGLTLALMGVGTVGVIFQGVFTAQLAAHGWWFVQEKVLFALPLTVVAVVLLGLLALPELLGVTRGTSSTVDARSRAVLVGAAAAGVAGVVARVVIGYPLEPVPALVLSVLVLVSAGLAYAVFARRPRRVIAALAAFGVLVLVASVGVAWLGSAALPGALATTHMHATTDDTTPAEPAPTGPAPTPPAPTGTSVTSLRTPADAPGAVRSFDLTAAQQTVTLDSGRTVSAWTYGSLPGPELRVTQGELVDVTLHNRDIEAGATIHWHGVDVPAGEDGVAGVTQDAVLPGESFRYRFAATDPGTYWYHTHQVSSDGVRRGLFGTLVVLPPNGVPESVDLTVPLHTLGGTVVLGDSDLATARAVPAGQSVRLRLINTDQVPHRFSLDGASFVVVAADGRDLTGGTAVTDRSVRIPAGGRIDLSLVVPPAGVRLSSNASAMAVLSVSPTGAAVPATAPTPAEDLDLLGYGTPRQTDLPSEGGRVEATMVLDRSPRFLGAVPAYAYTVNGAVFPHIPSIEVSAGNTVRLTVANRGSETHPMHVHGHHVLVIERDGIRSTGSPLWLDTFDVQPGEVWVVEFTADNPGIWMDHCHNLDHAAEGMMMALTYRGVTTPFEQGGTHANRPE